ncbi:MAG: ComEA family DNA-binding protein [Pseudomonadota bacterium]
MKNIFSICVLTLLVFSSAAYALDPTASDKPSVTTENVTASTKAAPSANSVAQQEVINLNTADAQTLTNLKGVGLKKAEAIIAWRKANGGFKSIEQFADVKGIGFKTLEANRKNLRVK